MCGANQQLMACSCQATSAGSSGSVVPVGPVQTAAGSGAIAAAAGTGPLPSSNAGSAGHLPTGGGGLGGIVAAAAGAGGVLASAGSAAGASAGRAGTTPPVTAGQGAAGGCPAGQLCQTSSIGGFKFCAPMMQSLPPSCTGANQACGSDGKGTCFDAASVGFAGMLFCLYLTCM
jgi:hypothetical protein